MAKPITAGELIEMLQLANDPDTVVKVNGKPATDFYYHEMTGVHIT